MSLTESTDERISRLEQALAEKDTEVDVLRKLGQAIGSSADTDHLLNVVAEIAVQVTGAKVRHHLRRWDNADLDVHIWVQTKFCNVVAQQEVMHRVFERHPKGEALPLLWIALVLVLVGQNNRLTVDVFNRGHDVWRCDRACT